MNQYATIDDFKELFKSELSDEELDLKLQLASERIDTITFNRIVGLGFDNLTSFQQENIKLATCFQANHMINNFNNDLSSLSGFSVLDISVNLNEDSKGKANKLNMSEEAYDFINKTGLTNRNFRR